MIRLTPEQRTLAARHVRRAQNIARSFTAIYGMFHWYDVLRSTALEALSKAAQAYDPSYGVPFEVFAWYRILGEVMNAIEKEARRLSFEPVLDAAARIEAPHTALSEADDETVAQIDSVTAEVMAALFMSSAGQERHAHGEAGLLKREAYADLDQALSQLAPEDRRLVLLRYWDNLPWKDVAERLGIPERTAKHHDQRIRRRLGATLALPPVPAVPRRDHLNRPPEALPERRPGVETG